jgi:hypothetical protein
MAMEPKETPRQGERTDLQQDEHRSNYYDVGDRGSEYLVARIARDRPDIHERLKQGEYPSARSAAIDAGIVKPRQQFTKGATTTPESFAGALFEKLEPDYLAQVVAILNEALGG